ncbi:MAG: sugar phosphate isomerase/epimerase family protein [Blautia marasmi]
MKLGVMTVILRDMRLREALAYLKSIGVQEVEIGCGGTPGTAHADAVKFMEHPQLLREFKETVAESGLQVAALACHGNPVHPDKDTAENYHRQFEAAVCMAEEIGVDTVIGFSGCPGDCETSRYPNWVVAAWPEDFQKIKEWQWNEKLIPYWKNETRFALEHKVSHIALEMHPGFCVYNPETLLKLRKAAGPVIGANVDPSHLFWQGIDPIAAIRALKGAIYHFHAKDTAIDTYNCAVNGVLDSKMFSQMQERSWLFRTIGYGHGENI